MTETRRIDVNMPSAHARSLGIEVTGWEDGKLYLKLPYAEHLVGDPDTGIIHGGVITAALDNASGYCIRIRPDFEEGQTMATLDLRIDYMRGAEPNRDLTIMAECFKMTKNIAFVRGTAWDDSPDDPVATSTAAFMMGTPGEPRA